MELTWPSSGKSSPSPSSRMLDLSSGWIDLAKSSCICIFSAVEVHEKRMLFDQVGDSSVFLRFFEFHRIFCWISHLSGGFVPAGHCNGPLQLRSGSRNACSGSARAWPRATTALERVARACPGAVRALGMPTRPSWCGHVRPERSMCRQCTRGFARACPRAATALEICALAFS